MRTFAQLYRDLDATNRINDKVDLLADYWRQVPSEDAAWSLYYLVGRRQKRAVNSTKLQSWAADAAGLPAWLFTECYDSVGDLAETISLVLPDPAPSEATHQEIGWWVRNRLEPLAAAQEADQRDSLLQDWHELPRDARMVWIKLITGGFRVGVSQELVARSISKAFELPAAEVAVRLAGPWEPSAAFFEELTSAATAERGPRAHYPFCLAHPLDRPVAELGPVENWAVEWKWDGIRGQLVRRDNEVWLWSRGEELLAGRFPEIESAAMALPPGTVIDGEILAWRGGQPQPFQNLQARINRKTVSKKMLSDIPVTMLVYDLLEVDGRDWRSRPLRERRERLHALLEGSGFPISEVLHRESWESFAELRAESRERGVEGFMLKALDSTYAAGRKRGAWWKWKIEPLTIDAVIIHAMRGSGKRAGLYTDYTFGLWRGDELVPFAKAYSGLTDAEIAEVDRIIRRTTLEKFGPVRTVTPEIVMEIAFEGVQESKRHKSGVATRFPRIIRWRKDKTPAEANSLDDLRRLAGLGIE